MSYILSMYSRHAFKECLLPAINNADYGINIEKELFDEFNNDVSVNEVISDSKHNSENTNRGTEKCRCPLI